MNRTGLTEGAPGASNVSIQATVEADTGAPSELTARTAFVLRVPPLTARRDRGLHRPPDQRCRAHLDPAVRRVDPPHRAIRRRVPRSTRSRPHAAVTPEHG